MLNEKGASYEHVSDRAEMAKFATAFGAPNGVNIAPPIIDDNGKFISQSTACTMYLGKKLGFDKGVDDCFAMQYLCDIVDWCEGGIGKNNEDAAALKNFMEGGRFNAMAGCVERNIKGPFFFGDSPSYVDFFLLQHMDWRKSLLDKLQEKTGKDFLESCPKIKAVVSALRELPSYKSFEIKYGGPFKQEIIDSY
jgi:glutathione S-transferase